MEKECLCQTVVGVFFSPLCHSIFLSLTLTLHCLSLLPIYFCLLPALYLLSPHQLYSHTTTLYSKYQAIKSPKTHLRYLLPFFARRKSLQLSFSLVQLQSISSQFLHFRLFVFFEALHFFFTTTRLSLSVLL